MKRSLETALHDAPDVDERSLANMASETLEELLDKEGAHAAPIARTFLAKIKRELDME